MIDSMRTHVMRHANASHTETAIPRVGLAVIRKPNDAVATIYEPIVCLTLQGSKQVTIGDAVLRYDASNYFVASLALPVKGCVIEASLDKPYIVAAMKIDSTTLAEVIATMPPGSILAAAPGAEQPGFAVSSMTSDLLEAWAGLLSLLDRPNDIAMLAPLREREILYRLLQGPVGAQLCQICKDDSRLSRVRRAIASIREQFDQGLPIATLAEIAGMSVASFHRHFRAATAMSPLQFQKALRLHAARRQLAAGADAGHVAYSVGYESASQFSREYARAFGLPPSRDADRMRGALARCRDETEVHDEC